MSINTPEIRTGFWLGLGFILAMIVVGFFQLLWVKARDRG
jgi:hypothetical protein